MHLREVRWMRVFGVVTGIAAIVGTTIAIIRKKRMLSFGDEINFD